MLPSSTPGLRRYAFSFGPHGVSENSGDSFVMADSEVFDIHDSAFWLDPDAAIGRPDFRRKAASEA